MYRREVLNCSFLLCGQSQEPQIVRRARIQVSRFLYIMGIVIITYIFKPTSETYRLII